VLGRFDRSGFEFAEAVEAVFAQGSFKLLVLREAGVHLRSGVHTGQEQVNTALAIASPVGFGNVFLEADANHLDQFGPFPVVPGLDVVGADLDGPVAINSVFGLLTSAKNKSKSTRQSTTLLRLTESKLRTRKSRRQLGPLHGFEMFQTICDGSSS
jgi:hypothetical protein